MRYSINSQKFLSDTELGQLCQTLNKFADKSPRDTALLHFMINTGARATEALNVRGIDLNTENQTVLIRGIKGSDDRELPLPPWLFERLVSLRAKHTREFLFDISYQRLDQIWRDFRPSGKKLHSLRHTFAIRLFKATKDLRLVQLALGHRNIQNTMVYASYVYSTDEMKRILL